MTITKLKCSPFNGFFVDIILQSLQENISIPPQINIIKSPKSKRYCEFFEIGYVYNPYIPLVKTE
jgi:hypothetical protein